MVSLFAPFVAAVSRFQDVAYSLPLEDTVDMGIFVRPEREAFERLSTNRPNVLLETGFEIEEPS